MKTHKLFPVWQFQREAAYLTTQAHHGHRLTHTNGWCYQFQATAALPGVVTIDYQPRDQLADYRQLLEDAGWQWLTCTPALGGYWTYWYHPDPQAVLYTDATSTRDLFHRIRQRWTFLWLLLVALQVAPVLSSWSSWPALLRWGDALLNLVVLGLNAWNFWRLTQHMHGPASGLHAS